MTLPKFPSSNSIGKVQILLGGHCNQNKREVKKVEYSNNKNMSRKDVIKWAVIVVLGVSLGFAGHILYSELIKWYIGI